MMNLRPLLFILHLLSYNPHVGIVSASLSSFTPIIFYRESDKADEEGEDGSNSGKRQLKLRNVGFITSTKRKSEEIESSGKGRSRFFQTRKLEIVADF